MYRSAKERNIYSKKKKKRKWRVLVVELGSCLFSLAMMMMMGMVSSRELNEAKLAVPVSSSYVAEDHIVSDGITKTIKSAGYTFRQFTYSATQGRLPCLAIA